MLIEITETVKMLQIAVTDQGKGFSREDLQSATELFYSGDKSRSAGRHYGMGLYISKSFIMLHKGKLELANSKETGGAKVTVRIPVV